MHIYLKLKVVNDWDMINSCSNYQHIWFSLALMKYATKILECIRYLCLNVLKCTNIIIILNNWKKEHSISFFLADSIGWLIIRMWQHEQTTCIEFLEILWVNDAFLIRSGP